MTGLLLACLYANGAPKSEEEGGVSIYLFIYQIDTKEKSVVATWSPPSSAT